MKKRNVLSKLTVTNKNAQKVKAKVLNCVIQEPFRAKISVMDEKVKDGLTKKMSLIQKKSVVQGKGIHRAVYGDMTLIYTTSGKTVSFDNILQVKKAVVK